MNREPRTKSPITNHQPPTNHRSPITNHQSPPHPLLRYARMRVAVLILCLVAVARCDEKAPTGPTVPLDQRVTLARGEIGVVEGSNVRVQFVAVTSDSRCP